MQWPRRDWQTDVGADLQRLAAGVAERLGPDGWSRPDVETGSVLLLHRAIDPVLVGTIEVDQSSHAGPYPWPFTLTVDLGVGLAHRTPVFDLTTMYPIASLFLGGPSVQLEMTDRRRLQPLEDAIVDFVRSQSEFFAGVDGPADINARLRAEISELSASGSEPDRDRAHYLALLRILLLSGFASRQALLDAISEHDGLPDSESGDEYREFAAAARAYYDR